MSDSSFEKSFSFNVQKKPAAIKLSPQKAKSLMQDGAKAIKSGNFTQATQLFSKVLASQPKNPTANYYLAYAFHALGDPPQAEKYYLIAVKEKPTLMQGWLNLANTYMLQEKFEQAETGFRKAIKLKPNTAQALYGLGMALGAQDKDDLACEYFFQSL